MGASTGYLNWLLYPNHLEPFSVRFSDKETEVQNSLLLATRTVQMNFVWCRTCHDSLRPLLREEASIHVEAEGFQLTASAQVNQDLLATQYRKAKARISAHTDQ